MADALRIQRPIGTRDFGPDEMAVRNHVAGILRDVFRRYGYAEVGTPTFEALELFTAKSGEGVIGELYSFKDKGDRDLTLRPELTAPVMRMYFAEHFHDPKPLKWSYFGNCFRYDRPQAGRYREFWQIGCEQIGAGTPLAYAELIALADHLLRSVGLRHKELRVGHVKVLAHCVDAFGFDPATRGALMRAIDKRNDDEIRRLAGQKEGCAAALDRLFLVMDAPTVAAARNALLLDETTDPPEEDVELRADLRDLETCLAQLHALGVRDAKLDLGIARGLDYYTGIVFEVHCPLLGAQKQLLGGGGYDLSGVFGAQPTPTMGFGLGFDRTIVALEAQAKAEGQPTAFPRPPGPALYVGLLGDQAAARMLPIVARLREAGVAVEVDLLGRKPAAIAKHADAVGARHLAIVGDRDLESGSVQLKDLATGQSEAVLLETLPSRLA